MKLGRNDLCWCGSGKKFKHCHLGREREEPVSREEVQKARKRAFGKKYCLHPQAGPTTCNGGIVRAHTIQRNGGLSAIAEQGHVYNCFLHSSPKKVPLDIYKQPTKVGIGQASTFTGFCGLHDNVVFAPLEKQPFQAFAEQIFLLGYRALCKEFFAKNADMELTPLQRVMDRGQTLGRQIWLQWMLDSYKTGVGKSIEELKSLKADHDTLLLTGDYSNVKSYVILFDRKPEFLCSAVYQPEFDLAGNELQYLGDLTKPASWLHFSSIATDQGGAAIFSWIGKNAICQRFIDSLIALSDDDLPHAIVRFAFEFFENLYFSPTWWDRLDKQIQVSLMERQAREAGPISQYPRSANCLLDDGIRAVNWSVVSRIARLSPDEAS